MHTAGRESVTPRASYAKQKPPLSRSGRIWKDYSLATVRTRRANAAFTGAAILSSPPVRHARQNLRRGGERLLALFSFFLSREIRKKWNPKKVKADRIISVSLQWVSLMTADSGCLEAWRAALTAGWMLSARAHRLRRWSWSCDCAQRKTAAENRSPVTLIGSRAMQISFSTGETWARS